MLLSHIRRSPPSRNTDSDEIWTARRFIRAEPTDVLEALTDPESISLWAPVDFEVAGLRGRRLRGGSHAIVKGSLAAIAAEFEICVLRADEAGFELHASGPINFEVTYGLVQEREGVLVDAQIKLGHEPGFNARVLRAATAALLSGGALDRALGRLARELDEVSLLAA